MTIKKVLNFSLEILFDKIYVQRSLIKKKASGIHRHLLNLPN